ncbi:MAG: hypothetical protein J3Q66DRAFT_182829 [Benniella sp.]|nr:MAG: hypothetical protein J3Q66DRAFT_182829 [Benniella sp.]
MIHHRNPSDLQQQHLRSPSPNSRDNESGDGSGNATGGSSGDQYSLSRRPNDSPPASTCSNSSIGGSIQLGDKESMQRCRNANSGGAATSPRNSVLPMAPELPSSTVPSASTSTSVTGGKTTVQFSEVVERAQQLQAKYGNRCKLHPWGCVEITEHRHLELTIKMYLDWAGLVASGRLTMDELPDLPEFRNIHPVVGGTLRRMASTPLSSLTGSTLNASSNGGVAQGSPPTIPAADDPTFSGSGDRSYLDGSSRSPSSSPPNSHLIHHQQQQGQEETHCKDMLSEASNQLGNINPSSAVVSAQRSIPSSPPGTHMGGSSIGNSSETRPHHHHPRARKMPSTPSLGQHRGLDHSSQHRTSERGSMISNSTASSPSSDADMLEGDDDVEEEDEASDASHYALSPWAKAPKDIAEARAAAVRARSAKSGHKEPLLPSSSRHEPQLFQEQAFAPQGASSDQDLKSQQDDEADSLERTQSRQQTEGAAAKGGPVSAMDAEGAVAAIGEIQHSTEVGNSTISTTGDSLENLCGNSYHGTGESTDVTTTKCLDLSMTECGEDDSMQTDEVNENKTAMETERADGGSEEGMGSPDYEANLGAKDTKDDRNPIQDLGEGNQGLVQEDSMMAET